MTYACFPPFDSACILVAAALIGVGLAARGAGPPDEQTGRKLHPRFWTWAGLYLVFIVALFIGLLRLGIAIDP